MSNRRPYFDLVKMAMMLWIVWGHLGLYGIADATTSVYMHNAKIGVNMPIFFVMSGYFAASTFAKSGWSKIFARAIYYMWPHVVLPAACAAFWFFVLNDNVRSLLGHIPFYWFLRTLAIVYVMCAVIYKASSKNTVRWFLFVLAYGVMFFGPQIFHWWWCDQVIHMFPYFVFGLMVLRARPVHTNTKISIACGAVFLLAVFLQGDSASNGMNFWKVCPYWNVVLFSLRDFIAFFARTVVGITGSIFVLYLSDVLSCHLPFLNRLSPLGRTSLGVYVIHEYPLSMAGLSLSFQPAPAWARWPLAIGWFLACHFIVLAIRQFRVSRFVVFGDEDWIQNKLMTHFKRRGKQ